MENGANGITWWLQSHAAKYTQFFADLPSSMCACIIIFLLHVQYHLALFFIIAKPFSYDAFQWNGLCERNFSCFQIPLIRFKQRCSTQWIASSVCYHIRVRSLTTHDSSELFIGWTCIISNNEEMLRKTGSTLDFYLCDSQRWWAMFNKIKCESYCIHFWMDYPAI